MADLFMVQPFGTKLQNAHAFMRLIFAVSYSVRSMPITHLNGVGTGRFFELHKAKVL